MIKINENLNVKMRKYMRNTDLSDLNLTGIVIKVDEHEYVDDTMPSCDIIRVIKNKNTIGTIRHIGMGYCEYNVDSKWINCSEHDVSIDSIQSVNHTVSVRNGIIEILKTQGE